MTARQKRSTKALPMDCARRICITDNTAYSVAKGQPAAECLFLDFNMKSDSVKERGYGKRGGSGAQNKEIKTPLGRPRDEQFTEKGQKAKVFALRVFATRHMACLEFMVVQDPLRGAGPYTIRKGENFKCRESALKQ